MQEIDELVPLEAPDIEYLESKRVESNRGCAVQLLVGFGVIGLICAYTLLISYILFGILAIVALLLLFAGLFLLLGGPNENRKVVLDLKEGNKRRIVAPITTKEIIDVPTRSAAIGMKAQFVKAGKELHFKYYMTVKDWRFNLTEEDYLTGPGKGDFVEFFIAPHSDLFLSVPIEVREETA